jgi:hypothetical protein
MKVNSVLLLLAFLFTGAKPTGRIEPQPTALPSNYESLPGKLNGLSENMDSISHHFKKLSNEKSK